MEVGNGIHNGEDMKHAVDRYSKLALKKGYKVYCEVSSGIGYEIVRSMLWIIISIILTTNNGVWYYDLELVMEQYFYDFGKDYGRRYKKGFEEGYIEVLKVGYDVNYGEGFEVG